MKCGKKVLLGLFCVLCIGLLPDNMYSESSIKSLRSFGVNLSTRKEIQLTINQSFIFPLLVGNGFLTEGNNFRVNLSADISPVSVNGTTEFIFTPIAVFQLVAGGALGSGWNIPIANGMRINEPGRNEDGTLNGSNKLVGAAFDGFVWTVKGGAILKFDFAAVSPGDWHHIVFRVYQGFRYRALTTAVRDDSWVYENNAGNERNGWIYNANYLLGYQMPLRLNAIGILLEQAKNLYDTENRKSWGDDLSCWTFGLLAAYSVNPSVSIAGLLQFRTQKNFLNDSGDYDFYQLRKIDRDNPYSLEFYRFGLNIEFKL